MCNRGARRHILRETHESESIIRTEYVRFLLTHSNALCNASSAYFILCARMLAQH